MTAQKSRMTAPERREQLIDVTRDIVGESGFHAVSIEAVARRAGITRPVVYNHFEDLGALFEAMFQRESVLALQQLAGILPGATGDAEPVDALLDGLRGYLEAVAAEPVRWRLVLMPPEGAPDALRRQIEQGREAVVAAIADFVASSAPGPSRSPDPALTARLLSGISDDQARLLLSDPDEYPIERLVAHARWWLDQAGV